MWRPEDWVNPYINKKDSWERLCFERGADTMLTALKKKGQYGEGTAFINPAIQLEKTYKGWLVFIPEEE